MKDRRQAVRRCLEPGEKVRWDGQVACEMAPANRGSTEREGFLLVTDHKLIFLTKGESAEILRFADIRDARFDKHSQLSAVTELVMESGDRWTFDGYPRLAKRLRKFLRRTQ